MKIRRLKHWGWGYQDQQPTSEELRATAAVVGEHLGLTLGEIESPVALEDVELAPPRVLAPPPLAETFETAITWARFGSFHERVSARTR